MRQVLPYVHLANLVGNPQTLVHVFFAAYHQYIKVSVVFSHVSSQKDQQIKESNIQKYDIKSGTLFQIMLPTQYTYFITELQEFYKTHTDTKIM
jgi:hypothetical protein